MLTLITSLFFAGILTPPLAAFAGSASKATILCVCLSLLSGLASLHLLLAHDITLWQWAQCQIILCSFLLAIGCAVLLLMKIGCDRIAASAILTVVTIAWLNAPVWLSSQLAGSRLHLSVMLHPLFVLNGIVPQLGIWTEQQVAYSLTSIGQDVQYDLPGSILPILVLHGLAVAFCWTLLRLLDPATRTR